MSKLDDCHSFPRSYSKSHLEAHLLCIASFPSSNTSPQLRNGWQLLDMHLFGSYSMERFRFHRCFYPQSNNGYQLQKSWVEMYQQRHHWLHRCNEAFHSQSYIQCGIHHQHTIAVLFQKRRNEIIFNRFVINHIKNSSTWENKTSTLPY